MIKCERIQAIMNLQQMMQMSINDFVEQYKLCRPKCGKYAGKIGTYQVPTGAEKGAFTKAVDQRRSEINAFFDAEEAALEKAAEERQKKIDAIPGLHEIEDCEEAWDRYHTAFDEMIYSGKSIMRVTEPEASLSDLTAKYPRAAAFVKARAWSCSPNFAKASAGEMAMEEILNGEDYKAALKKMETKWSTHALEHAWD